MTSASTYTYGIGYNPVMGVVTRARGGKKGVQGFLSVDPLTRSYPMLTPYQFASNSPIAGIDLDGLEYLDYRDAMVELRNGEAHLKLQNAANWTNGYVQASGGKTRTRNGREVYETEVSTYVGNVSITPDDLNDVREANPVSGPPLGRYAPKASGNSKQRIKYRRALARDGLTPGSKNLGRPGTRVTPRGRRTAGGALAIEALEEMRARTIRGDFNAADAQFDSYGQASIDAFQKSLDEGLVLPDEFNTDLIKSDIANYILQGELLGDYNDATTNRIKQFAVDVMSENGIPIREESLPVTSEQRP